MGRKNCLIQTVIKGYHHQHHINVIQCEQLNILLNVCTQCAECEVCHVHCQCACEIWDMENVRFHLYFSTLTHMNIVYVTQPTEHEQMKQDEQISYFTQFHFS